MVHAFWQRSPQLSAILKPSLLAVAVAATTPFATAQEDKNNRFALTLEEVVVTAQKREESAMSVPISINTFTRQDIINTGALTIEDIDDFMPGVQFGSLTSNQSTQLSIEIRGISSPNISSGGDPSVSTFYDNAYMPRAVTSIPFTDIARVEVLKGPQGTLFGRNATVGVVNIVPNRPTADTEGYVQTRLGNYGLLDVEGVLNLPLTDRLAMRAALNYHERDPIFNNVGVGDDMRQEEFTAARLAFEYALTDDTVVLLAGDYEDRDDGASYAIGVSTYAESIDPFNDDVAVDTLEREEDRDMYGLNVQLDHAFNEELSLFGIVSYRSWETFNKQDEDGTAEPRRYLDTNNIEDSDIWYSELRFNFVYNDIDWIVGTNYSKEDVKQRTDIGLQADSYMQFLSLELLPFLGFPSDPDVHAWDVLPDFTTQDYLEAGVLAGQIQGTPPIAVLPPEFAGTYFTETMQNTGDFVNWGIFTDLTYQLTDSVRLIGGLRYSYDKKDYSWQTFPQDLDWPFAPVRVAFDPVQAGATEDNFFDAFEDSESWDQVTGRAVAEWDFLDTAMTYLSVATGYKSGGYDGQIYSSVIAGPFDPEEITSYEWGLKGDFFEDRVRVEFAAFYMELENSQTTEDTRESPDDPTAQPTVVSTDEDILGWEIVAHWQIIDSLRIAGLTTWRENERTQAPFFDSAGEPAGGRSEKLKNQWDYTLRLDWTPNIPVGFLLVHVDYIFNDAEDPSDDPIFTTGPWYFQDSEILNARIAWANPEDNLELAVWGKNLLDKEYADNPGGLVADTLGAYKTNIEDPLTYGVEIRYTF
ncbi:MAG: TonB-dependent receptor [Pseudomonadota bacterium]